MIELKEMETTDDYHKMMAQSTKHPVLLFKHSTTCPISAAAFEQYQSFLNTSDADLDAYLIKVIENRDVSNYVEANTNVKHESPQIFLIKDKDVSWHTSHSNITAEAIKDAL